MTFTQEKSLANILK